MTFKKLVSVKTECDELEQGVSMRFSSAPMTKTYIQVSATPSSSRHVYSVKNIVSPMRPGPYPQILLSICPRLSSKNVLELIDDEVVETNKEGRH